MILRSFIFFLCIICFACSSHSPEDFREEGNGITRELIYQLRRARTSAALRLVAPVIKESFDQLVDVVARARAEPGMEPLDLSPQDLALSDRLHSELKRIYQLEGGREIIEECQKEALHRLDAMGVS